MKNFILVVGGFLIVALIGAFVVLKMQKSDEAVDKNLKEALTFLINPTKAEVFAKNIEDAESGAQTDFSVIQEEVNLKEGSEIKTSANGRASVLSPDQSITNIGPSSDVKLARLNDGLGTKVFNQGGAVWSRVQKVSGSGSVYEVETENMVGAVRGTAFATTFSNGITDLYVLEGTVWVNAIDPTTGEKIPGDPVVVTPNKKIQIDSKKMPKNNSEIKIFDVTGADLKKTIIFENWQIGEEEKTVSTPTTPKKSVTNTTPTQNPPQTPAQNPTSTPTQTQTSPPQTTVLKSVSPTPLVIFRDISGYIAEITLQGEKLSSVTKVLIDLNEIQFQIISDTEIKAVVPNTYRPDIYDVSVLFDGSKNSTLTNSLEIKWNPPEQTRETPPTYPNVQ